MNENQIKQPQKIKDILWQLAGFLVVVAIIIFGSTAASRLLTSNSDDIEEKVTKIIKEKRIIVGPPACEESSDEFLKLKKQNKYLKILGGQKSHGSGGRFIGGRDVVVSITGQDEIACGYLYVRASKSNKPLEVEYDSVYVNPQRFGGHILRSKSIYENNTETYTEALISLDSISYLPGLPYNPDAQNYKIADWSKLLNVNSHVIFSFGLSTTDVNGIIEEIGIAYKCWDSNTGIETSNCQLSVE